jgi:hypothetical protein
MPAKANDLAYVSHADSWMTLQKEHTMAKEKKPRSRRENMAVVTLPGWLTGNKLAC